ERDRVKFTGGKCQVAVGFSKGQYPVVDLGPNGTTIRPRDVDTIPTMATTEDCFGDVDAEIHLRLPEGAAEAGLRIALESVLKPYSGIPFMLEYRANPSVVRVIGPKDLNSHTSKGDADIELEVKAEKAAPDLDEGNYTLSIRREGTRL